MKVFDVLEQLLDELDVPYEMIYSVPAEEAEYVTLKFRNCNKDLEVHPDADPDHVCELEFEGGILTEIVIYKED